MWLSTLLIILSMEHWLFMKWEFHTPKSQPHSANMHYFWIEEKFLILFCESVEYIIIFSEIILINNVKNNLVNNLLKLKYSNMLSII